MRVAGGRLFAKMGAEGFHCAGIPAERIGIALKAEDGARRAAEPALLAVLKHLGAIDTTEFSRLHSSGHSQHPKRRRRLGAGSARVLIDRKLSACRVS